ncbi:MAG: hypothetical protein ACK4K7_03055 [Allosphingosinicella sp.]|uniref:hypothetical protein n=1 Tax=Allosphingosinicella sp. TaxID=2823234 RepID=UPI00395401A8
MPEPTEQPTKQMQVVLALKALVETALPTAHVRGFDRDTSKPRKNDAGGTVIGHPGEPGEPEVDLSPLTFHYSHRMYLELIDPKGEGGPALDAMIKRLGEAIAGDRTLGGLVDWLQGESPDRNDRTVEGLATGNWAVVPVVANYSTEDPLA